jgi:lauroyl/myristoyl acyltransferase
MLARLPYRPLHASLGVASRLEAWLRWPLRTLDSSDRIGQVLRDLDPEGDRFGLTPAVRKRYTKAALYESLPDLFVLLSHLDDRGFLRRAVNVRNGGLLKARAAEGRGVLVAGFRLGPHAALPYLLAALGHKVSMIVSTSGLAGMADRLGRELAPAASRRLRFLAADDSLVLTHTLEELKAGRVACTLMELGHGDFKTNPVRFLDWEPAVPYGVPYLAAVSGCDIVPALITRHRGPRFRLTFLDPIPAPARDRASIFAANQALYSELERQVRRFPAQWPGWTLLESQMGINLRRN